MNMFDELEEVETALNNGIAELERDSGNDAAELMNRMERALVDLWTASRKLRETIES